MHLLLVEDDPRIRQAIGDGLRVNASVTTAGSVSEAVRALALHPFDLALIDIGLPDGSGLDVVTAVRRKGGRALVLTTFADEDTVLSAVARGADGYLLKSDTLESLDARITQCLQGASPVSAQAARHLFVTHRQHPAETLTPRERDLLTLLARGLSYADCAHALHIGVGTVQTYVKVLYRKLDVCSKTEAATWALRHGLS